MKNRIKKFCREHPDVCIYGACLTAEAIVYYIVHTRMMDGARVAAVATNKYEDGAMSVRITHRNGYEEFWDTES